MDDSAARPRVGRRIAAYLIPAAVPAVLVGLYHLVRLNTGVMDAVNTGISAPARAFLARVSSGLPFVSLAETLCTALVLWVLYHIIRTVSRVAHRRGWRAILLKRLYAVALVALYIWALFCWLWGVGYFASGFAARSGLGGAGGVELQDLYGATVFFANLANERSADVARDDGGHFAESVQDIIALSDGVYDGISGQFPALGGAHYPPKPMLYSRVYSRLGFTGFYFALTGESNINTDAPGCLMPSTVAHELAHQLGVFAEEEANFAGIAACVTSGIPVYEYSGALSALLYLSSALRSA
ncbi:MAG: DUF3810 domain-containing protein, partial [Oscillospiraceae bacterium]|nr:DUF3810 domain-containing protein [Oscillospiraceae bacterium]